MSAVEITCKQCRNRFSLVCEEPANMVCQRCDSSTFVLESASRLQKFFGPQLLEEKTLEKGSVFNAKYMTNDGKASSVWTITLVNKGPEPTIDLIPKPVFVPIEQEKQKEPVKAPEQPKKGITLRLKNPK